MLIDERAGRAVARRHDLETAGVIGILMRATRAGTIDLEFELDHRRRNGFWISEELSADVQDEFESR